MQEGSRDRGIKGPSGVTKLQGSKVARAENEHFVASLPCYFATRHCGALTLIELLVVVTLVGVAAATVTVRLGSATDRARLRAATLQLEQAVRLARHRALTRRQPVWLELQMKPAGYRIRTSPAETPPWRWLEGVRLAATGPRSGRPAASRAADQFTIRLTPSGAWLPWALEMQAGNARRVIWSDGAIARIEHRDDIGLAELTQKALGMRE